MLDWLFFAVILAVVILTGALEIGRAWRKGYDQGARDTFLEMRKRMEGGDE